MSVMVDSRPDLIQEAAQRRGYATVDEAMVILRVARRTIFKYIAEGKLTKKWQVAGSRTVIPMEDIMALLEPRTRTPPTPRPAKAEDKI